MATLAEPAKKKGLSEVVKRYERLSCRSGWAVGVPTTRAGLFGVILAGFTAGAVKGMLGAAGCAVKQRGRLTHLGHWTAVAGRRTSAFEPGAAAEPQLMDTRKEQWDAGS